MPSLTESELDSSMRISYPILCIDVKTEVTERMPKVAQPVHRVLGLEPRAPDPWPTAPCTLPGYFLGRLRLCS